MSETFWKGEPVENLHRDVLIEIARQQHFRLEVLEAALREIAAMEHLKVTREIARAALAPEQDK